MRILTGIKPTGNGMHIGNYFGAFKPLFDISKGKESFFMIPDIHSLTSVHSSEILKNNKKNMLLEHFSLLPDDTNIIIFEQSKAEFHEKLAWILLNVTPYSMMLRAHSFKDSQNKNSDINMGVFNYPILMAADILLYDIDKVPVGKDQKQHLEFTRDIAGNFNKVYKTELFNLPDAIINESFMTIPGTDGRKMSKSYDNFIGIFDDEKLMKKKIMSIKTDDTPLEEPKDYENCNVFNLIKLFATEEKQEEIKVKYKVGGYGYGHAKLELLELILKYFEEPRKKYQILKEKPDIIYKKLEEGNSIMKKYAENKYREVEKNIGLN